MWSGPDSGRAVAVFRARTEDVTLSVCCFLCWLPCGVDIFAAVCVCVCLCFLVVGIVFCVCVRRRVTRREGFACCAGVLVFDGG